MHVSGVVRGRRCNGIIRRDGRCQNGNSVNLWGLCRAEVGFDLPGENVMCAGFIYSGEGSGGKGNNLVQFIVLNLEVDKAVT